MKLQKPFRFFFGALVFILLSISGILAKDLARYVARGPTTSPKQTEKIWISYDVDEFRFDAPFELIRDNSMESSLSAEARALVDIIEPYKMKNPQRGLDVRITFTTYKTGINLSTEGAVKEGIRAIAIALGEQNPQVSTRQIDNKEYDGFLGSYGTKNSKTTIHINALALRLQQKILVAQIIWDKSAFTAEEASRLLSSFHIRRVK